MASRFAALVTALFLSICAQANNAVVAANDNEGENSGHSSCVLQFTLNIDRLERALNSYKIRTQELATRELGRVQLAALAKLSNSPTAENLHTMLAKFLPNGNYSVLNEEEGMRGQTVLQYNVSTKENIFPFVTILIRDPFEEPDFIFHLLYKSETERPSIESVSFDNSNRISIVADQVAIPQLGYSPRQRYSEIIFHYDDTKQLRSLTLRAGNWLASRKMWTQRTVYYPRKI